MTGCSSCGGSKSGGYSKQMKNWGGMKSSKSTSGRKTSSSGRRMTGGGGYGKPSVSLSFGGKKR